MSCAKEEKKSSKTLYLKRIENGDFETLNFEWIKPDLGEQFKLSNECDKKLITKNYGQVDISKEINHQLIKQW